MTKNKNPINVWEVLRKVDTPTICNAIEVVKGKRQLTNFSVAKKVYCVDTSYPPIVGFALTASISASSQIIYDDKIRKNAKDYYTYMAKGGRSLSLELAALSAGDPPFLTVIEDKDGHHPIGAFWGEVNVTIHQGMGICGTLTNGLLRDIDALPRGYQVIAGGIGPSHAFVHVREVGGRVNLLGLQIAPHDIIHADRHGAVKVEHEIFPHLPEAIAEVLRKEEPIIAAARRKPFDLHAVLKAIGIDNL